MNVIGQIKAQFKDKIEIFEKSKCRIYVTVAKEDAKALVRYMFREMGARFSIASGIDTRPGIEIIYHMAFDKAGILVNVRTLVAKPELSMPTFTDFLPAADWIEREIHELLGVNFLGHPNLATLLLADDWEAGVFPLRKQSFDSEEESAERGYQ